MTLLISKRFTPIHSFSFGKTTKKRGEAKIHRDRERERERVERERESKRERERMTKEMEIERQTKLIL